MPLNVVKLPVEDRRSVDSVLDAAREKELEDVIVIGYDKDGKLWTAVNLIDGGEILWMLELTKAKLLHKTAQEIINAN